MMMIMSKDAMVDLSAGGLGLEGDQIDVAGVNAGLVNLTVHGGGGLDGSSIE